MMHAAPSNSVTSRTLAPILVLCALLSSLGGCSQGTGEMPAEAPERIEVTLDGRVFELEFARDQASRVQGLSGRTEIPESGGMLFSFPRASVQNFVMRDCLVPIDIIFLDGTGRITATHHMSVEPSQADDETDEAYERRLKRYSSRYAAKYVIEIQGGLLETMDLENGQMIVLETELIDHFTR